MTSSFVIKTEHPISAIVEFVALCTDMGCVQRDSVQTASFEFTLKPKDTSEVAIAFTPKKSPKKPEDHSAIAGDIDLLEPISVLIGLHRIATDVRVEGQWASKFPTTKCIQKLKPSTLDSNTPIDEHTLMTLCDLSDIYEWLIVKEKTIDVLVRNAEFKKYFPFIGMYSGEYCGLRHCKGHEVFFSQTVDAPGLTHSLDAPNPALSAFRKWYKQEYGVAAAGYHRGNRKSVFQTSRAHRFMVAREIGSLPADLRPLAFNCVFDWVLTLENYHDTRGGIEIPEVFECELGDTLLTMNHSFSFEFSKK